MVSLWGASSLIKSVQSGEIVIPSASNVVTATITSVATENAVLIFGGIVNNNGAASPQSSQCSVVLTNATTVTGQLDAVGVSDAYVRYAVVELVPGVIRSVQRGTLTLTGTSGTATITQVDTAKCLTIWTGCRVTSALDTLLTNVALTNGTTVTGSRGGTAGGAQSYAVYEIVELF
jgi:hypothetical protein